MRISELVGPVTGYKRRKNLSDLEITLVLEER